MCCINVTCKRRMVTEISTDNGVRLRPSIVQNRNESKSIYIAPFCTKVHTKRSGMDHTVLPANNTMPVPFLRGVHQMSPPQ